MLRNNAIFIFIIILCFPPFLLPQSLNNSIELKERNMGGPRIGVTIIHGRGELANTLEANNMGRYMSQFGWHFEYQVSPKYTVGPSFVVQFLPLFGGVEYGKFIPSVTTAFGIRFPNGIEFDMGPNLIVSKNDKNEVKLNSSLVIAGGISLNYGGVSIPLNLAYAISPKGNRASFIFGYALD